MNGQEGGQDQRGLPRGSGFGGTGGDKAGEKKTQDWEDEGWN